MNLKKLQLLTEELLRYCSDVKSIPQEKMPTVNFVMDEVYSNDPFGKTGAYNPNTSEIYVFVPGRHYKDIMRSVAHEFVHHVQNLRGDFKDVGELGEGYAQKNKKMRKMEAEAYLEGNMMFRDWTDTRDPRSSLNESKKEKIDFDSRNLSLFNKLLKKWTKAKK
tara:strand:- start:580 stop:1071 length:492 start_codon:yes stop_codon:yes gene_type:complete